MDFLFLAAYALVYFAGYYGAHLLNLASRRPLIRKLRIAGLLTLAVAAAAVVIVLEVNAPPTASSFAKGYVQGQFAIGPALIVAAFVAIRMWLERRKARRIGP